MPICLAWSQSGVNPRPCVAMAAVTMEDLEKLKKYFEDSLTSISQRVEQVDASDKQLMSTGFAQVSQRFDGLEEKIAASLSTGEKNIASAMTAAVTSETLDQKLDQLKKYADDKFEAGEKNIKDKWGTPKVWQPVQGR